MGCSVSVIHNVQIDYPNAWSLCFQYGEYFYDDGSPPERGYRFMWKYEGRLRPQMGQARIPSREALERLIGMAQSAGWYGRMEEDG